MYERGAMPPAARALAARLGKLNDLRREVNLLSQRAAELEARAQDRTVRVAGIPYRPAELSTQLSARLADTHARLVQRRAASLAELGRLYAFIDDIPDPGLRLIFTYRYVDGLTWLAVAHRTGGYDEQLPRKKHNAYLRRIAETKNAAPGDAPS